MVLSNAVFQRSPVLSGLLRYLINETIEGRANNLKSFIVAVDALGRKENFDSASDSSARVQMGRLRKALEVYYTTNASSDGDCIYLLPGSYIVRLDPRAIAYPTLPPLQSKPETFATGAIQQSPASPAYVDTAMPFYWRAHIIPLLIITVIGLTATAAYFGQTEPATPSVYRSPVLEIIPTDNGTNPNVEPKSRLIANILADDLSRFKMARVQLANKPSPASQVAGAANLYRLYSRMVTDKNNTSTLYLSIDDARANVLIWSRVVILPANPASARAALIPAMGEINGSQGIISSYESVLARSNDSGGYPCFLKYLEFARFHNDLLEKRVAACLEKPVVEKALAGTMLGVRAMFEIERRSAVQNMDIAYQRGIPLAQAAVEADANDGWANFAMARLSYLKPDCQKARFYTQRTLEANPNSPVFSSVLAGLASLCNYPLSEKLLDQAIQTQSPYYGKARLLMVLAALSQNRPEKIDEIYEAELPLSRDNRSNFYLTEAMIAASKNNRAQAERYWRLFEANAPKIRATPEEKLQNIIMVPALRQQVLSYLRKSGVPIGQKKG